MTDDAKEPQPDALCTWCAAMIPPPSPRIALVDGDTTLPLSAEALVVALFACGLLVAKNPAGQLVGITFDHAKVIILATALQAQLDQGETLKLEQQRIARPGLA